MIAARKGISPVIATVIIVAVAIAISIAVAGWLMGLWGGFGQTESLKIFPDSYVEATDQNGNGVLELVLHVQNVGGSPAQIYKVEISGVELTIDEVAGNPTIQAIAGQPALQGNTIVLNSGDEAIILFDLTKTANGTPFTAQAGVAYTVTIYTEAGNVYTTTVYGK